MTGRPDFVVVTGLSGAGKSQGAKVFEDLGYYILDNLPPALMGSALDVARKGGHPRVAMVVDARSGALFTDAAGELERLDTAGTRPHVLFFDASDDVLLRRYSETRHRHPLETTAGVQPSIEEERRLLVDLRARADKVIDTTHLTVKDLRDTLHSLYGEGSAGMLVQLISFGYKYGLPPGADLVLDVRFMENPFYIEALRPLSGSDDPVRAFVLGQPATRACSRRSSRGRRTSGCPRAGLRTAPKPSLQARCSGGPAAGGRTCAVSSWPAHRCPRVPRATCWSCVRRGARSGARHRSSAARAFARPSARGADSSSSASGTPSSSPRTSEPVGRARRCSGSRRDGSLARYADGPTRSSTRRRRISRGPSPRRAPRPKRSTCSCARVASPASRRRCAR